MPILAVLLVCCDGSDTENTPTTTLPNAEFLSHTDCKNTKGFYATANTPDNQSCIEFLYVDSTLHLTHVNAGFNCCPGNISSDFVFDGTTITISEGEATAECFCECLYDLEMEIENLPPATYTLVFEEPYAVGSGNEIAFSLNLNDSTEGSFCVSRNYYPWAIGGQVLKVGECKNKEKSIQTAANLSCIEYSFDEGVLMLDHINAGFNCCPGQISATFSISGNQIVIEESEEIAGCNCNCLNDIDLMIGNIQLGTYHITFIEPYAAQPGQEIEFTINLNDSVSGSYCVQRNNYPWGLY